MRPVCQIRVSRSSPGNTILENLTANLLSRLTSDPPTSVSTAHEVNAMVHRPWAMIPGSPASLAISSSR
ncbi:Uncharacterised protein [Mycobacteroides abscessus subsp. abscessus]|nr:Uncharacterised protein [Mycobacteroides abscessus subsp. abscessus]